jgi:hypothetical protein
MRLSDEALAPRYPEEEFPTQQEAQDAAEFAAEIVAFIRQAIGMGAR